MQACELRRAEPGGLPKANGLGGQIVRMLDYRGLLERFSAQAAFAFPRRLVRGDLLVG
jgi:hypothetical protein